MRRLIICFSLSLVAGMAEPAGAQVPPAPGGGRISELTYRPPRPRVRTARSEAQILQHRKAVVLAEQRVARIETRKWYGVSLVRPFVPPSRTGNTLDLNAALLPPGGGWYVGPVWWP